MNVGNVGLGRFLRNCRGSAFAVPRLEKRSSIIIPPRHLEPDGKTKMRELENNSVLVTSVWPLNSWRGRVGAALSCGVAGFVIGYIGGTFGLSAQTTVALIMVVAGIPALSSLRAVRTMHRKQSEGFRIALVPV